MIDAVPAVLAFIFGACIGSFLNVCIARWPHDQSVVSPRSRCPNCGLQIAWYDNIPIISWLLLRGRCRHCGEPISWRYPAVELAVALIWGGSVLAFAPGPIDYYFGGAGSFGLAEIGEAVRLATFLTILLGIAFLGAFGFLQRDWRIHRVPSVGLAAAPVIGFLFGVGWTPCVGPTLAAINVLSVNEATATRGAVLSAVFALGLGLPFIAAALAYRRMLGTIGWVRRHQQWVTAIGGLMLIAVGLLLVTGWWGGLVDWLRTWFFPDYEAGV